MNIICISCREPVNASSVICLSCGRQVPRSTSIRGRFSVRTAWLVICFFVLVATAGAAFYGLSQTARLNTAQFGQDILAALESMENGSTLIPARDACTLLSKQEVEDAIGIPVSQVRSVKNDASHTRCLYLPEGSRMKAVDLKVDWTGGVDAMSLVQSVTPQMIPDTGSVSGLGDVSFYGPMDSTVYVLKGDTFVSLIFGVDEIEEGKQISLAEKAVSKL